MEDRCVPISSAQNSFIYLFVDLLSSAGQWKWYFAKLGGRAALSKCRTKVDAGQRSNQRQHLERDVHIDYLRVFGKWATKQRTELNAGAWVCLHFAGMQEDDCKAPPPPKKKNKNMLTLSSFT